MLNINSFMKLVLRSFFAIVVYLGISNFSNLDPIKEGFDDYAYDKLITEYANMFEKMFGYSFIKTKVPNLNLFVIDDDYLKQNNLVNYGYYFPRKEMTKIVESLNLQISDMDIPPKLVFIDYDLHYTEMPYGRELSIDDKLLIQQIEILTSKTILLIPKAKEFHFIEEYFSKIPNKNLFFVSPNFLIADDLLSRRFQSYYEHDNKIYPNVDYVMYLINQKKCKDFSQLNDLKIINDSLNICGDTLQKMDITENRFIPKFFVKNFENQYNYGYTNWDNNNSSQNIRPISTLIEESVVTSSMEDSIIMIGGDFANNHDKIPIAYSFGPDSVTLPGIMLHLNALNSFHYLNGTLKNINFIYGSIIVFTIFLLFSFFEDYNESKNKMFIKFFFNLTAMTIIFSLVSLFIFIYFKLWFNWFAPLFAYQLLETLYLLKNILIKVNEFRNEYFKKKTNRMRH